MYAWNGDSCELKLADIAPSKSKYEDFVVSLARLSDVSPALLLASEADEAPLPQSVEPAGRFSACSRVRPSSTDEIPGQLSPPRNL